MQYLVRVGKTYYFFTQATRVSGILAEATWAIVAFNLLLYMHGAHVFGALWYTFAMSKAVICWEKACMNHFGRDRYDCYCDDSLKDYSFLNNFCGKKTGNTTNYDFGLFSDALQSGILEVTVFPMKLLHCLQWGLQNLSGFGQNLKPSNDVVENIFTICMTMYGVVLFVFLVGKMQSNTERSQKIKLHWQEIKQWPLFKDMSGDVQGQIRTYKRNNWRETKRVDVDNLINGLPEGLGNKVKRKICLNLLKNIEEFNNWNEQLLENLCDFLKPVYFAKRTRIIREGDPIDEILFVLRGKLWTYTSRPDGRSSDQKEYLEDGDIFGAEQLVPWALDERSSGLPISNIAVRALTDVEGVAFMANELKHVLSPEFLADLLVQQRRRLLRARPIQVEKSWLDSVLDKLPPRIIQRWH